MHLEPAELKKSEKNPCLHEDLEEILAEKNAKYSKTLIVMSVLLKKSLEDTINNNPAIELLKPKVRTKIKLKLLLRTICSHGNNKLILKTLK
jgi:hypothetical protein